MGPAYRLAARVLHRLPYPPSTLAASMAGRREADGRWTVWAAQAVAAAPLIWTHAASVGETMALVPVVSRLRVRAGSLTVILTHTSPSLAGRQLPEFDHIGFLPFDEPGRVTAVLGMLNPSLMLFSRGDLWPELVTQAAERGIPVAVAGAVVGAGSARLRWPARRALTRMHEAVSWVGAVSDDDAERWHRLGVPAERITVTGDPRHDQVVERIPDLRAAARWRAAGAGALTVVAGSVERRDDALLAEAVRVAGDQWRWLVVPHHVGDARVRRLEATFTGAGVEVARWDGTREPPAVPVTLMSRAGVLADLYWAADVAFVGGGGKPGALHAVAEPAAAALPVAAGPHLTTVRDGRLLEAAGGATAVRDAAGLVALLDGWAASAARRRDEGFAARAALETGGAERTVARVQRLIDR